jgi:hypothetical protein
LRFISIGFSVEVLRNLEIKDSELRSWVPVKNSKVSKNQESRFKSLEVSETTFSKFQDFEVSKLRSFRVSGDEFVSGLRF